MAGRRSIAAVCAFMALTPSLALAHAGGESHGFMQGFVHPVSGLDHLLAMLMVGVLAVQLGRAALWLLPLMFIVAMAAGGTLGASGAELPFAEIAIGLSVIVLGAVVAFGAPLSVAAAVVLVGLFAVFHGFAHGAEMPADAGGLGFGVGFMTATALLHVAGIGLGLGLSAAGARRGPAVIRTSGMLAALAGAGILAGLV